MDNNFSYSFCNSINSFKYNISSIKNNKYRYLDNTNSGIFSFRKSDKDGRNKKQNCRDIYK